MKYFFPTKHHPLSRKAVCHDSITGTIVNNIQLMYLPPPLQKVCFFNFLRALASKSWNLATLRLSVRFSRRGSSHAMARHSIKWSIHGNSCKITTVSAQYFQIIQIVQLFYKGIAFCHGLYLPGDVYLPPRDPEMNWDLNDFNISHENFFWCLANRFHDSRIYWKRKIMTYHDVDILQRDKMFLVFCLLT